MITVVRLNGGDGTLSSTRNGSVLSFVVRFISCDLDRGPDVCMRPYWGTLLLLALYGGAETLDYAVDVSVAAEDVGRD